MSEPVVAVTPWLFPGECLDPECLYISSRHRHKDLIEYGESPGGGVR